MPGFLLLAMNRESSRARFLLSSFLWTNFEPLPPVPLIRNLSLFKSKRWTPEYLNLYSPSHTYLPVGEDYEL